MQNYDPKIHKRCSIRLWGHDYSEEGAYFVTICAKNKKYIFGKIVDCEMILNKYGQVVYDEWFRSVTIRHKIEMDEFVIMPNHIHGIVIIHNDNFQSNGNCDKNVGAHGRAPLHRKPKSLGSFVAGFKSATTKQINILRKTPGAPVWQRNYYERVIRNDDELAHITEYIMNNTIWWHLDRENPDRTGENDIYKKIWGDKK
ncbi:MAG: transposase, partial [bacterium]